VQVWVGKALQVLRVFPRGFATMIKEGEKLQVSTGAPPGI